MNEYENENARETQGQVRVMTRADKMNYDDITIDQVVEDDQTGEEKAKRPETFNEVYEDDSRQQDFRKNFRSYGGGRSGGPRIYTFHMGSGRSGLSGLSSWKYKLIGAVAIAAILLFLFFVALPVVAIGVVVAVVAWFLYSLFG